MDEHNNTVNQMMYLDCHAPSSEPSGHPVCRFLVQSLCSSRGRAKNDFYVDLVLSVDGLLTLVKSVYGILKRHRKLEESYRNLHWRLHFHGDVFTLADPEIHNFCLLKYGLRNGQSGWFEGSTSSFRFSIFDMHAGEISHSLVSSYPKIELAATPRAGKCLLMVTSYTSLMKDDWLSDERKEYARHFKKRFRGFMSGANVWSQNATGEIFRDRPKPPKWTEREEQVLICLIHAGSKFQESWQNVLQHAFVNRSEVGTAQQWYKIRKRLKNNTTSRESTGESNEREMIIEAKAICTMILEDHLKAGVPELGEHPHKRKVDVVSESQESSSLSSLSKRRKVSFSPSSTLETGTDDGDGCAECS